MTGCTIMLSNNSGILASKPFAPRSFAGKKQVLKLVEGLSGHCLAIRS